jgi:hypothetical protein
MIIAGCSTHSQDPKVKIKRENLIPNGVYEQKVHLSVLESQNSSEKQFSFKGVLKIENSNILVLALSPFGTTEFRLIDDGKNIKTEVFREGMEKLEPQIKNYYLIVCALLKMKQTKSAFAHLKWIKENSVGLPTELSDSDNRYKIESYDQACIPTRIKIENQKFKVDIRVTKYEEN